MRKLNLRIPKNNFKDFIVLKNNHITKKKKKPFSHKTPESQASENKMLRFRDNFNK